MSALVALSRPSTSPACTGIDTGKVLTPPVASFSDGPVPAPVKAPPEPGVSTRNSTIPPVLPVLTEKLVTVPVAGTCSSGTRLLNGTNVQLPEHAAVVQNVTGARRSGAAERHRRRRVRRGGR